MEGVHDLVRSCNDGFFLIPFLLHLRVVFHVVDDVRHLLLDGYLRVVVGTRVLLLCSGLRFLLLLLFLLHCHELLWSSRQIVPEALMHLWDRLALLFEQMQSSSFRVYTKTDTRRAKYQLPVRIESRHATYER
jgi:hypothetical protein